MSSSPPLPANSAEGRSAGGRPSSSEPADDPSNEDEDAGGGCYRYFGVRSHLHQLYDYSDDAAATEDAESGGPSKWTWWGRPDAGAEAALLPWRRRRQQQQRRRRSCGTLLWLAVMWLGAFSLFAGLALMLAGYAVPRQSPVIGYASLERLQLQTASTTTTIAASAETASVTASGSGNGDGDGPTGDASGAAATAMGDLLLVDRSALDMNAALDACKVAGLVTLCSGGVIITLALAGPLAAARPLPCAAAVCRRPRRSATEENSMGTSAAAAARVAAHDGRRRPCDAGSSDDEGGAGAAGASKHPLSKPAPPGQVEKVIPAEHFVTGVQPRLRPD